MLEHVQIVQQEKRVKLRQLMKTKHAVEFHTGPVLRGHAFPNFFDGANCLRHKLSLNVRNDLLGSAPVPPDYGVLLGVWAEVQRWPTPELEGEYELKVLPGDRPLLPRCRPRVGWLVQARPWAPDPATKHLSSL